MRKWIKNSLRAAKHSPSALSKIEKLEKALNTSYKLSDKHKIAYEIGCQYKDQHLSAHREAIEFHLMEGEFEEAKLTLLNIIDIVDELGHFYKAPPAPWYYEQLSNIFQLEEEIDLEKELLKRYMDVCGNYGEPDAYLLKRYQELCKDDDENEEDWEWRQQFQPGPEVNT